MKLLYILLPLTLALSVLPCKQKETYSVFLWGTALILGIVILVMNATSQARIYI